ncbi:MAG: hypothetical protein J6386_13235 [Candidatus Synoicihabitans palmerolidicus]|nr:hypothetical protein [Candidatus Synoicihabitans palmerolidicus]
MKRLRLLILTCVFLGPIQAAAPPLAVKILPGILYHRGVSSRPLPTSCWAEIIDLRFQTTAASVPTVSSDTMKIVLLDSSPSIDWTIRLPSSARLITLAPVGTTPQPDVTIQVTSEELRNAVEAIDSGVDVVAMAKPAIEKARFDESSLVRRHNGEVDSEATPSSAPAPASIDDEPTDQNPARSRRHAAPSRANSSRSARAPPHLSSRDCVSCHCILSMPSFLPNHV